MRIEKEEPNEDKTEIYRRRKKKEDTNENTRRTMGRTSTTYAAKESREPEGGGA